MPNTAIVSTLRLFVAPPSDCDNERGVQRFTSTSTWEKGNSDIAKMMKSRQNTFSLTKNLFICKILFENNLISPLEIWPRCSPSSDFVGNVSAISSWWRSCVASAWTSRSTKQRVQSWQWDVTTNGSINDTLDLSGGYPFRLNLLHRKFWEPSLKGGSHFIFMIFGPFSARDFFGMNYDVLILRLAIFHLGDIPIEAT